VLLSREQLLLSISGMLSHCPEPDYNSNWQQPTEVQHYVLKMHNGFTHSNKIPSARNVMYNCHLVFNYNAYIVSDNFRWRKGSNHCKGVGINGRIMLKTYFRRNKL
jgi:hypothetical protein